MWRGEDKPIESHAAAISYLATGWAPVMRIGRTESSVDHWEITASCRSVRSNTQRPSVVGWETDTISNGDIVQDRVRRRTSAPQPKKHCQGQAVFARMPRAVTNVIGAFAMPIADLVVPQTIFRTYLVLILAESRDRPE